jgi:hypothetical protein
MDNRERLDRAADLNRLFKNHSKEQYFVRSGNRLNSSIYRKFRTTFIGALSEFEKSFSHLWGYKKPLNELTESELYYRRLWEDTRTRILNNGNNQARAAENEISEYEVEWKRYRTDLRVRGN